MASPDALRGPHWASSRALRQGRLAAAYPLAETRRPGAAGRSAHAPGRFDRALRAGLSEREPGTQHSDPFDRLLVAQASVERMPLLTVDAHIRAYDVECIP